MHDNLIKSPFKKLLASLKALSQDFSRLVKANQKKDATTENTKPDEKSRNKPLSVIASLSTPVAISVEAKTQERKTISDQIFKGIEILGIAAVVVYAVLVYFQYREMINATEVSAQAINEARQSRLQAEKLFKATIEQSHLDQRAWIGVGNISGQPKLNEVWKIIVAYHNSGRTPAKNFSGYAISEPVQEGDKPNFSYTKDLKITGGLIPPGGDFNSTFNVTRSKSTSKPSPMIQPILDTITSGQTHIYIHGRITYDDIFGCQHWMTFCYYTHPETSGFASCSEHNDTGDGVCKR